MLAYVVAMFMMGLVYFTPLGITRNSARRWLRFPVIGQIQPSEIMKIAIVIFIPYLICKLGNKIHKWEGTRQILAWGFAAFLAA